jgi:hypothetical protein
LRLLEEEQNILWLTSQSWPLLYIINWKICVKFLYWFMSWFRNTNFIFVIADLDVMEQVYMHLYKEYFSYEKTINF